MMTLCALSLNPNLSMQQFRELSEEYTQAKERCYEMVGKTIENMQPEEAVKYLHYVLPMLMLW